MCNFFKVQDESWSIIWSYLACCLHVKKILQQQCFFVFSKKMSTTTTTTTIKICVKNLPLLSLYTQNVLCDKGKLDRCLNYDTSVCVCCMCMCVVVSDVMWSPPSSPQVLSLFLSFQQVVSPPKLSVCWTRRSRSTPPCVIPTPDPHWAPISATHSPALHSKCVRACVCVSGRVFVCTGLWDMRPVFLCRQIVTVFITATDTRAHTHAPTHMHPPTPRHTHTHTPTAAEQSGGCLWSICCGLPPLCSAWALLSPVLHSLIHHLARPPPDIFLFEKTHSHPLYICRLFASVCFLQLHIDQIVKWILILLTWQNHVMSVCLRGGDGELCSYQFIITGQRVWNMRETLICHYCQGHLI